MQIFAKAIPEVGKCLPPDVDFDINDLTPSTNTIKNAISKEAKESRQAFKGSWFFSSTWWRNKNRLYDTFRKERQIRRLQHTILRVPNRTFATDSSTTFTTALILLKRHNGSSTTTSIQYIFSEYIEDTIGVELDTFTQGITWMTHCPSNMASTRSSIMSKRFDLVEKWMGCIVFQMISAILNAI